MEITSLHKDKEKEIGVVETLEIQHLQENKTETPLPFSCDLTRQKQIEYNFTLTNDFALGTSVKLSYSSIIGVEIGGQFEKKTGTSNSIAKIDTVTVGKTLNPTCPP